MFTAMGLMLTLSADSQAWHLSAFVVVLGLGAGLAMPTISVVIQNAVSHQYLGVATSSRQFFMQIGGVLGTAIFGVLLTTTFQSEFRNVVSPEAHAAVAPETLATFEDPTLSLDTRTFGQVQAEIMALPDGEVLLEDARSAQRQAIAVAIHQVFLFSIGVIGVALVLSLLMKERPLRRVHGPPETAVDDVAPAPALSAH
jgi:hypothetical protein